MANKQKTEAKADGEDGEEAKKGKGKAKRPHGFALTEMDYWSEGEGNSEDDSDCDNDKDSVSSEKETKKQRTSKKRTSDKDDENIGKINEDSDEGDREGYHVEYMTSESSSDSEIEAIKEEEIGIDQEVELNAFDEDEYDDNCLSEDVKVI
jgi:hypothetical protein